MELKPGYKQTEVGVIPEDWQVKPLLSLTTEIGDGIHSTPNYVKSSEFYFVNGNNLVNDRISITASTMCVSESEYKNLRKNLSDRTLLLSINGTIGNLALYNGERVVLGKSAAYINVGKGISRRFISCCLKSRSTSLFFDNELTGTTIRNLSLQSLRSTPVPMPPRVEEQRAIARALSDVDALIGALEQLIAKKRDLKQAVMQELLTGKKRLPGFKGDWEVKRLGELLKYEQPTNYLVKDSEYSDDNDVPVLTAGKTFILGYTNEGTGIFDDLPVIIFDDFTTANKYVTFPFKAKSSAMKMLKPRDPAVNLKFIFEVMQLIKFQLGDHKRYWISEYQNLEIKVPKAGEQTTVIEVLSDMDAEISALEQRREKTRAVKHGMMQELLTGRIRLI